MSDFENKKNETADEVKSEKKHSNAKTGLIVITGLVVACLAFMILSGSWNPFKSREVVEEAKQVVENSKVVENDFGKDLYGDDVKNDRFFGEGSKHPNGLTIDDYGSDGKDGCLKETYTASADYNIKYGLTITMKYMINQDYAKEVYIKSKSDIPAGSKYETKQLENGEIYVFIDNLSPSWIWFNGYIGTTQFFMKGELSNISKMQPAFDKLGIDYKVPTLQEIQSK